MKKILSLMLALIILLSLCACKASDHPDSSTDHTTESSTDTTGQTAPSETTGSTEPSDDPEPTVPTETTEATEPTDVTDATDSTEDTTASEPVPCQHERSRRETSATCTQPGLTIYECMLCGDVAMEETPAKGHRFTNATCLKAKSCTVCGVTDGAALGHNYANGSCTRCGAKMPDEPLPPGCVHEWSTNQTAPTCTATGTITYTCTKCNHQFSETIPANGHSFANATCDIPQTCNVCSSTQGAALGHSYTNGTCDRCGAQDPSVPTTIDYRVTVRSDKGDPVEGVTVQVYTTGTTPSATGKTNNKGVAIMTLVPHTSYEVVLSDVPPNFSAKERYTFTYHIVNINLTSVSYTTPTDHSHANYKVGSTMGDFTLTDTDGITYTLSELLQEKELIILDFWYVTCGPCKSEFPYFENIYKQYADNVQLLTFDPFYSEDQIKALREEMGVTFPMIQDTINLHVGFNVEAYPTTIFIDNTGTILKIEKGAYSSEQELINDIERFL